MAKILIAGEDYYAVELARMVVEAAGHEVIEVNMAMDVVDVAIEKKVDLVVVEENMTTFRGTEVSTMMRYDPDVPEELPILLMITVKISPRKLEAAEITEVIGKGMLGIFLEDMLVEHLGDKAGGDFEEELKAQST